MERQPKLLVDKVVVRKRICKSLVDACKQLYLKKKKALTDR